MGMAQALAMPAAISLNEPCGGVDCPAALFPQQAIVRAWRSPQVKFSPADIWVKAPCGDAAWSWELSPQQTTAPFSRKPQAWALPAVICVNRTSAGGLVGYGVGEGVGWAVGVAIAALGGEGVAVGAGDGVGCAAIGWTAADGGAGVETRRGCGASLGGKGAGAGCVGVAGSGAAGWGAGGWTQAARAMQIAAQRAVILGEHSFCPSHERICVRRDAMAVRSSNSANAPCLNCAGPIISKFVGGVQIWRDAGGRRFLEK